MRRSRPNFEKNIDMKRYKAGILSTILPTVLVLTLALSACVRESLPDSGEFGEGLSTVTLELVPPGAFSEVQTRALTDDQQNAINRAAVFIFKGGVVVQKVNAEKVEGNKMTVKGVKTSQSESDKFDVVVIGNPRSDIDMSDYIGLTKEELRKSDRMFSYYDGKWSGTEFPMWGEATGVYVHPISNTFQIKMLRALARIDLGVGAYDNLTGVWGGLTSFKLSEITLKTHTTMIDIIPKPENIDLNGKATGVSSSGKIVGLSTEGTYSGADIIDQTYIKSTIFLAETESPRANPVKLIIGGAYNGGATTYYRVDMRLPNKSKPGEYLDLNILRNHLYRISITSVSGPGYATIAEATSAPALNNIAVELTPIDEGGSGDVIFDAHSSITTDVSGVQIYGTPDGVKTYTIATVKANFATGVTATVTGPGISGTLNLVNGVSQTITVAIPASTTTGSYTIKVGRLTKVIPLTVQAAVDAHFDFLPFQNVASIIINDPQPWLTLSNNRTYVKGEQQSAYVTGDAQGKAVVHFDENIVTTGDPRTAQALVARNNRFGTTRVVFEQLNLSGMVMGLFGGAKDNYGYTKQLAVESVDEFKVRIYDDTSIGTVKGGMLWGFNNIVTSATNIELGTAGTITLARRTDSGIATPYNIYNNYAARYCYDKNRDTNGNGILEDSEIVWYLPAQNQLMGAWIVQNGMSKPFGADYYRSATEFSWVGSWNVSFDVGYTANYDKTFTARVRCVREI